MKSLFGELGENVIQEVCGRGSGVGKDLKGFERQGCVRLHCDVVVGIDVVDDVVVGVVIRVRVRV